MTTTLVSLGSLATQINAAHDAVGTAVAAGLAHARRAGELLIQAKDALEHGDWLPWLTAHCPTVRERTAQAYMRIAREWPALEAKAQRVADLPMRQAIALLAEPQTPDADDLLPDDEAFEADERRTRSELAMCERMLTLPDLTLTELEAMIHRTLSLQNHWASVRIRAERHVGLILNRADAIGWGPVLHGLLEHPEHYDAFLQACDRRIAELGTRCPEVVPPCPVGLLEG